MLKEQNLLPKIICGSSAGSLFAALIACRKYEEIEFLFNPYSVEYECFEYKEKLAFMKIARFLKDGVLLDIEHLQGFLKKYLGNLTFEEAHEQTGWILNVSVSSIHDRDVARLLNYVTSPNVLIWSAVSASCAIPYIFRSVELLCKDPDGKIVPYTATKNHRFIDGSVAVDLPMQRLSEIFNVNTFIVSQVNPFVIPLINDDGGGVMGAQTSFIKKIKTIAGNEAVHWVNQLSSLGLIPDKLRTVIGLINQTYKGNVTISPQVRISDYWNLLRNPTPTYIKQACRYSELNTYNKMALIKSVYEIEREISDLYQSVQHSIRTESEVGNVVGSENVPYDINLFPMSTTKDSNQYLTVTKDDKNCKSIKKSKSMLKDINKLPKGRKGSNDNSTLLVQKPPLETHLNYHGAGLGDSSKSSCYIGLEYWQ